MTARNRSDLELAAEHGPFVIDAAPTRASDASYELRAAPSDGAQASMACYINKHSWRPLADLDQYAATLNPDAARAAAAAVSG